MKCFEMYFVVHYQCETQVLNAIRFDIYNFIEEKFGNSQIVTSRDIEVFSIAEFYLQEALQDNKLYMSMNLDRFSNVDELLKGIVLPPL